MRIEKSTDVRVEDVHMKNPGFWNLVPVRSEGVRILRVNISAERTRPQVRAK